MHIQFAELPVVDQDRASLFYQAALGCAVVADSPMEGGWRWIELGLPGARTRLHLVHRHAAAPDDAPVLVLVDEDVRGCVARLRDRGVTILSEPNHPEWEPEKLVAEFRDSEGNRILLSTP